MRICAVTSYIPYPLDTGDSLRIFGMFDSIAQENELVAACVLRPDSEPFVEQRLAERLPAASTVLSFPLDSYAGRMNSTSRATRVGKALTRLAPPQMFTPYSSELADYLTNEGSRFDAVVLIGEPAGLYARFVPHGVRLVWDKANVISASFALAVRSSRTFKFRAHAAVNAIPAYVYEKRVARRVDAVWVTSDDEASRLRRVLGISPAATIPSTAAEAFDRRVQTQGSGTDVVWLSSFGYPPNWDGLRRYLEESAGDLAVAGLRLRVIGKGATPAQQEWLGRFPMVDFLGYQDDLLRACEGARAAVVPLWVGAGVKLKTITLMQLGLPVAATRQAMEGIPHDCALVVSDDPSALTRALVTLTDEESNRAQRRADAFLANEGSANHMRSKVREAIALIN